jgi:hypothetical protein
MHCTNDESPDALQAAAAKMVDDRVQSFLAGTEMQQFMAGAQSHPQAKAFQEALPPDVARKVQELWSSVQQDGVMSVVDAARKERVKDGVVDVGLEMAQLHALAGETMKSLEGAVKKQAEVGVEGMAAATAVATDRFGAAVAAAQGGDINMAVSAAQEGIHAAAASAGDLISTSSEDFATAAQGSGFENAVAGVGEAARRRVAAAASAGVEAGAAVGVGLQQAQAAAGAVGAETGAGAAGAGGVAGGAATAGTGGGGLLGSSSQPLLLMLDMLASTNPQIGALKKMVDMGLAAAPPGTAEQTSAALMEMMGQAMGNAAHVGQAGEAGAGAGAGSGGDGAGGGPAAPNPMALMEMFMAATAGDGTSGEGGGAGANLQGKLQAFIATAQSHPQAEAFQKSLSPEVRDHLQQIWSTAQQGGAASVDTAVASMVGAARSEDGGAQLHALAGETMKSLEVKAGEGMAAVTVAATDRFKAVATAAQGGGGGNISAAIADMVGAGTAAQRGISAAASQVLTAGDLLSASSSGAAAAGGDVLSVSPTGMSAGVANQFEAAVAAAQGSCFEAAVAQAGAAAQRGMSAAALQVSTAGDLLSASSSGAAAAGGDVLSVSPTGMSAGVANQFQAAVLVGEGHLASVEAVSAEAIHAGADGSTTPTSSPRPAMKGSGAAL